MNVNAYPNVGDTQPAGRPATTSPTPATANPTTTLSRVRRDLPSLQHASGNAAVVGLLQRNAGDAPTVENWPTTLPRAVRSMKKKENESIHVELGTKIKKLDGTVVGRYDKVVKEKVWPKGDKPYEQEYVIRAPTLENAEKGLVGTLTAQRRAFVDSIEHSRQALDISTPHLNRYQGKYGWQYGGTPRKDATPTAMQGTADTSTIQGKRKQAEQWMWEDLRFEESSAWINADFFVRAFESVGMSVKEAALAVLTHDSAGLPKIMHEIGDAANPLEHLRPSVQW